jgi:hypothetical protein
MADDEVIDDAMTEVVEYTLTTVDNPYHPTTQFDEWYAFDEAAGYHTCALLARIVRSSDDLSDTDQQLAVQLAIAEIAEINASGMHMRVLTQ